VPLYGTDAATHRVASEVCRPASATLVVLQ